jgi:ubiquinol-cytochrome c reductase cytochrome b subunit
MFKWWFALLVIDFVVLMWVGSQTPSTLTAWIGLIGTYYWFGYFLIVLPLLGVLEKPLPQPATIEEDFNAHYGDKAGHPAE